MVRVSSTGPHSDFLTNTRQLPINIRRGHAIDDQWGWCDLPIRLTERARQVGGTVREPVLGWESGVTPYELQVMMVWGSHKAMLGMMSEQDVVEGVGLRAALALARENPW